MYVYIYIYVYMFAYPQIEVSNQLRVRCCGHVVQYEPHIACVYIYMYVM